MMMHVQATQHQDSSLARAPPLILSFSRGDLDDLPLFVIYLVPSMASRRAATRVLTATEVLVGSCLCCLPAGYLPVSKNSVNLAE